MRPAGEGRGAVINKRTLFSQNTGGRIVHNAVDDGNIYDSFINRVYKLFGGENIVFKNAGAVFFENGAFDLAALLCFGIEPKHFFVGYIINIFHNSINLFCCF